MNTKLITIIMAFIITLGGSTGIYAAANAAPDASTDTSAAQTESTTAATTTVADETDVTVLPVEATVPAETTAPIVVIDATGPTTAETMAPIVVIDPTTPTTVPVDVDDDTKTPIDPASVAITEDAATATAMTSAGTTAVLVKVELEDEDGVILYEIKIKTDTTCLEIKVDANTGVILSTDVKNIDDEDSAGHDKDNKNNNGKNFEAFLDNAARKSGDANWDGETRKNDLAFADNAARKADKTSNSNCQNQSENKSGEDSQK